MKFKAFKNAFTSSGLAVIPFLTAFADVSVTAFADTIYFGDVNSDGSVNALDASAVLRHSIGTDILEGNALAAADVDGSGRVNALDAALILRYAVGDIKQFPAGKSFTPESKPETAGTLQVYFGADGTPFTMYIYDNPTAAAIAKHVGTARWQLPIYHYDDYTNWEVMQYYDIPSRYEIPSNAEAITSEKAGEVYYSEPNRIVLFYGDAEVSSEYTPVGYFDPTPEFISAVENNPVLEGWGNKIVIIEPGD